MKHTCVIIDDHELFSDGLRLILKESNKFKVLKQVFNSKHAYHTCASLKPDMALIDFNMPHLNGLEVVEQLNRLNSPMRVVIISMYAERSQVKSFKKLGVHGFISKTTKGADLVEALVQIMTGKTYFESHENNHKAESDSFSKKNLLTKREIEILKCVKNNLTNAQMAEEMGISQFTVETHRKNINRKLNFETKQELYKFLELL